jgi:hypothetical protein
MNFRYRLRPLVSLLPDSVLNWLVKHWMLDYDPSDGWTFWIDVSYYKWVRKDKRRARRAAH